jgi:RNA polymerase-binding transcription factor DksA
VRFRFHASEVKTMWDKWKTWKQLIDRLEVLEARQREIEQLLREPEESDPEEQALEADDDEALEYLARIACEEMDAIREAVKRIYEGTYQRCRVCGKPIAWRRLRALPHAATCVRCARVATRIEGAPPLKGRTRPRHRVEDSVEPTGPARRRRPA